MKFLNSHLFGYYSIGLLILSTTIALVFSILYYRRHKDLRIFTFYIALSLLADLITVYAIIVSPRSDTTLPVVISAVVTYVFMLAEVITYHLFVLHYIDSLPWRRIIRVNGLAFFIALACLATHTAGYMHNHSNYFAVLESAFLVPPCLIYFYRLFQTVSLQPLREQPPFWIITGVLFLKASSIPLMLTRGFLGRFAMIALALNCMLYSLSFILMIRAYLCKGDFPDPAG